MRKATHSGTCQICGREQMLPGGGKMAKHGYTKRWGFFSGTCTGSDGMPFETHTDLVEAAIARAKSHAADLRKMAKTLKASDDVTQVWMSVYHAATWSDRNSFHRWELLPVVDGTVTVKSRETGGGYRERAEKVADYNQTLLQAVQARNARRADVWLDEAKKFDGYVKWQTKRLAEWKPMPLKSLNRDGERSGPLVHFGRSHWGVGKACSSSYMASQTGHWTTDTAKVTCAKCKQTRTWAAATQPTA